MRITGAGRPPQRLAIQDRKFRKPGREGERGGIRPIVGRFFQLGVGVFVGVVGLIGVLSGLSRLSAANGNAGDAIIGGILLGITGFAIMRDLPR